MNRTEILSLLRELEWACDAGGCPSCHEWGDFGHAPDCRLKAAIEKLKRPEPSVSAEDVERVVNAELTPEISSVMLRFGNACEFSGSIRNHSQSGLTPIIMTGSRLSTSASAI